MWKFNRALTLTRITSAPSRLTPEVTVTLSIIDILHCYLSYDSLLYSTIAGYSSIAIFSTISSEEGMDVMEDHDQEQENR